MTYQRSAVAAVMLAMALGGTAAVAGVEDAPKPKKPSVTVKASPAVSFSPARVVFVADLKGGSDDFEEFYCADVEWEWGDGTESEKSMDCEPYEAGKSKIQRHFTTEHRYETAGEYRVVFRLRRQDKIVGAGTTVVRVRPGLRDIG
jgi:hypothetical protein